MRLVHTPVAGICACLRGMRDRESKGNLVKAHRLLHLIFSRNRRSRHANSKAKRASEARQKTFLFTPLEAVGHLGFIEAPDSCLQALDAWLD